MSKSRRLRIRGTGRREWILAEWQVVYGDLEPDEHYPYENYVPRDAIPADWLNLQYGPYKFGNWTGRIVARPKPKRVKSSPTTFL